MEAASSSRWTLEDLTTLSIDPTLTPAQAQEIQQAVAKEVQITPSDEDEESWPFDDEGRTSLRIAAMDISYPVDPSVIYTAASLVLVQIPWPLGLGSSLPSSTPVPMTHLKTLTIRNPPPPFPYIPGLLAFRELSPLLSLLSQLDEQEKPDLLLCDGQGIAHPARCGLASHLGVLMGLPSIGSAKNWFIGRTMDDEDSDQDEEEGGGKKQHPKFLNLPTTRGSRIPLYLSPSKDNEAEEPISNVLRSQTGINPIFVSPGHRISLHQATEVVLALCGQYRLPDPIRMADHSSREALREWAAEEAQRKVGQAQVTPQQEP
ncbi:hypothetical protein CF326_g3742 [Tilletia indica]|nr:hypothetical protein CF326_g3742 [Tilletia indica]